MTQMLMAMVLLLPQICQHPGTVTVGYFVALRRDYLKPKDVDCFVYRYNVGQVCFLTSDGGGIVLDPICGYSNAAYNGKLYEVPMLRLPVPKELR